MTSNFRNFVMTLVAVLVAAVAFASPAQAEGNRVVVLGDSLVGEMCGGNHQSIPTRFVTNVTDVGCYGWPGATSGGLWRQVNEPGWVDPANVNRSTQDFDLRNAINQADTLVIGLGTNNALRQQPTEWYGWDIDNFMRLANGRKVIWFDTGVRVWPNSLTNAAQLRSAVAHNTVLWAKKAQYPNLRVMAWGGEVGFNSQYVIADGVHLTGPGYIRRWNMVRENL